MAFSNSWTFRKYRRSKSPSPPSAALTATKVTKPTLSRAFTCANEFKVSRNRYPDNTVESRVANKAGQKPHSRAMKKIVGQNKMKGGLNPILMPNPYPTKGCCRDCGPGKPVSSRLRAQPVQRGANGFPTIGKTHSQPFTSRDSLGLNRSRAIRDALRRRRKGIRFARSSGTRFDCRPGPLLRGKVNQCLAATQAYAEMSAKSREVRSSRNGTVRVLPPSRGLSEQVGMDFV